MVWCNIISFPNENLYSTSGLFVLFLVILSFSLRKEREGLILGVIEWKFPLKSNLRDFCDHGRVRVE